jgi:predicted dehydrogenase
VRVRRVGVPEPRGDVPLRAAVVGVGAFGRHHARIYAEMADLGVELVGLVDRDSPIAEELALRYGVPLVASVDALPVRPDLVSVAVSTTQHRAVAEPLLRGGIHCLIEKPIADRSEDAEALVAAAAAGDAWLHVGHVERFNPVLDALRNLTEAPTYIEAHRLAPHRARARDVGVVMDLMIHDLEILNHLVGEEASGVEALTRTEHGGGEDVCAALLSWPSGCVARVVASRVAEGRGRGVRIWTAGSYLRLDLDAQTAAWAAGPASPAEAQGLRALRRRPLSLGREDLAGRMGPEESARATLALPIAEQEPLQAEILGLVASVRTGAPPRVGGQEGLRALRLAEWVLAAARSRPARAGA